MTEREKNKDIQKKDPGVERERECDMGGAEWVVKRESYNQE